MRRTAAPDPLRTAEMLIERHGIRAAAVVSEYAAEAVASGDAQALHRWHQVQAALGEIRRTERMLTEPVGGR